MSNLCLLGGEARAFDFWSHWSDGQAEVSGYVLLQPRYGEIRRGHAALIFVTEPFSRKKLVKVDAFDQKNPDHFIALKLNMVKRFQTGVYDYAVMTSLFTDPQQDFGLIKGVFSSQEWCGQVFEKLVVTPEKSRLSIDSYFEGESLSQEFEGKVSSEDSFWIQARGLGGQGPGQDASTVPVIASATLRRLRHLKAKPQKVSWTWSPVKNLVTPKGVFSVRSVQWSRLNQSSCQLHVELEPPFRIIGWDCTDGESARLTGSKRIPYWNQSRLTDEALLKDLGLPAARR